MRLEVWAPDGLPEVRAFVEDAMLDAQIPQTAAIKRSDTLRAEAASLRVDRHTAFRW